MITEDDEFERIERELKYKLPRTQKTITADDDDDTQVYKRPWVSLTNAEIQAIYLQHHNQYAECVSVNFGYEKAIEAKLKEKNL